HRRPRSLRRSPYGLRKGLTLAPDLVSILLRPLRHEGFRLIERSRYGGVLIPALPQQSFFTQNTNEGARIELPPELDCAPFPHPPGYRGISFIKDHGD